MSRPQQTPPDKVALVNQQVQDLKVTVHQNIDKAIQRGERLDELEEKADRLQNHAMKFQKGATELKWQMCFKNWKYGLIIFLLLVGLILLLVWVGGGFK